jgi:ATP-binding cassette subfamily F protein uup
MRNPNFLILDEPTNDLDIATLNVLEDYLADFKGCVIVISHDRYFMDRIVDHILVFKGNADIQDFPGNYTQYRLWKEQNDKTLQGTRGKEEKTDSKSNYRNPSDKKKLSYKEQRELEALEKEIPELEDKKAKLEEALSSGNLSVEELNRQSSLIGKIIDEIDEKTFRWLELSEITGD